MDSEWIVGRKEIEAFLHRDWRTVRRWKKRYGLQLVYFPGRRVAIQRNALNEWLLRYKPKMSIP
jgi:hypothetical protein